MTDVTPQPRTDQPIAPILEASDRITILGLAAVLIGIAALFYLFIGWQGLLNYASTPAVDENGHSVADGYFSTALDYRERRLALALTYRTFITTLGFTVGLVLCTIGGVFVLRRANANLTVSGILPGGAGTPGQQMKVTLATTSPGIAFMLTGAAVMFFTQVMALPVGAPEIYPRNANAVCPTQQREDGSCSIGGPSAAPAAAQHTPPNAIAEFCSASSGDPDCDGYRSLIDRLEIAQ